MVRDKVEAKKYRIRDYTTSPLGESGLNDKKTESHAPKKKKAIKHKKIFIPLITFLMIAAVVGYFIFQKANSKSPVPKEISKSVPFPVYYPDEAKLPKGYALNRKTINSPQVGVVLYTVNYGSGQKLVFSVQQKPSEDDLAHFVKQYIPINRKVLTPVGTATEGAINNQTVVSLPTDDKSWIIITGPPNIYATDELAKVLKSITEP